MISFYHLFFIHLCPLVWSSIFMISSLWSMMVGLGWVLSWSHLQPHHLPTSSLSEQMICFIIKCDWIIDYLSHNLPSHLSHNQPSYPSHNLPSHLISNTHLKISNLSHSKLYFLLLSIPVFYWSWDGRRWDGRWLIVRQMRLLIVRWDGRRWDGYEKMKWGDGWSINLIYVFQTWSLSASPYL